MTELTIQFNYVQDCVVLLREDFLKYTCVILPKEITRGHADNLIKRCRHTVLEDERIRPLLFDLLENIATTKLPNGRYEYCDGGWGICKGDAMFVLTTVNDEGNIVIRSPYFQKFLLSFNSQEEDFSIEEAIEICKVDIDDFVKRHPENFPLDLDYTQVSFGIHSERW